jgi:hypothetical protein
LAISSIIILAGKQLSHVFPRRIAQLDGNLLWRSSRPINWKLIALLGSQQTHLVEFINKMCVNRMKSVEDLFRRNKAS